MSNYYVGRDNSPQLKHWKYIKRVRKNGKWKYYYDADQLRKDLGIDAREAANRQHDYAMTTKVIRDLEKKEYVDSLPLSGPASKSEQYKMARKKAEFDAWDKKYKAEAKKYYELKAQYHKTPLGKVAKAVEIGKNAIEAILGKDIWQDFKKMKQNDNWRKKRRS